MLKPLQISLTEGSTSDFVLAFNESLEITEDRLAALESQVANLTANNIALQQEIDNILARLDAANI